MASYPIHEIPISHFSNCISEFLAMVSLSKNHSIRPILSLNSMIWSGKTRIIPDLHLDLRPGYDPSLPAIPLWVMECGFSSDEKSMKRKLAVVVKISPEMDAAFMISICEKNSLPLKTHHLCSLLEIPHSEFKPSPPPAPDSWGPIEVEGINWLLMKSVKFHVFL